MLRQQFTTEYNPIEVKRIHGLIFTTIMETILAIIGPTASGKSTLALSIAKKVDGEIIGLDSRQIYKDMPIGTAQPTEEDRKRIYHHLIGIREPTESVSAGEYAELVLEAIDTAKKRVMLTTFNIFI